VRCWGAALDMYITRLWVYVLFHPTPSRALTSHTFPTTVDSAKMHSFLFPEDINGPSTRPRLQQSTASTRKPTQRTNATPPRMPTRAPPTIPQQAISAPPPPTYAPPPIPMMKEKPAISITEVSIPDQRQEPGLQRSKSKWSRREIVGISTFKERREAKARAAAAMPEIDVVLPPLSPVVDEEFWRTGRYPTEPGMGVVHVVF
jgi:hypothetical protein